MAGCPRERLLCEASEALRVAANDLRLLKRHLPNSVARDARKAAQRIDRARAALADGARSAPPVVPLDVAELMAEALRSLPPLLMSDHRCRVLARFDEVAAEARPSAVDSSQPNPAEGPINPRFPMGELPDERRTRMNEQGRAYTDEVVAQAVAREVAKQDERYGPFGADAGGVRLGIACLEDEVAEALESWSKWKDRPDWFGVREEAIQVAAVACRLARVPVEDVD